MSAESDAIVTARRGGKQLRLIEQFNSRVPVGTPVLYWPCPRENEGRESVTRSEAWLLGGHTPVVLVEGYAGGIALSHVMVHWPVAYAHTARIDERRRPGSIVMWTATVAAVPAILFWALRHELRRRRRKAVLAPLTRDFTRIKHEVGAALLPTLMEMGETMDQLIAACPPALTYGQWAKHLEDAMQGDETS